MEGLWSFKCSNVHTKGSDPSIPQPGMFGLASCKKQGRYGRWNDRWQYSRRLRLLVRCQGTDASHENMFEVHRRHVLLTLAASGVGALPSAATVAALAAPVQPPNLKQCNTPINGVDCCLPISTTITDFKLPQQANLRVRRPAHNATKEYIAQYEKAYQLLHQLPASDPRQFAQQANVHCAFCDAAYVENGTSTEYQVHNSWFFFPWHRWFLYFHERILASVLKDPSFALPFWNWDSSSGSTLPPMYSPSSSPLYDTNRNPRHVPPAVVDLNFNLTESGLSAAAQLAANNTLMYRQLVSTSTTPSLFFGRAYRQGGAANPGGGTVENVPHGTVHVWTGNPANAQDEDMGALYSAARDPIFFAHHANLDRLWEVWKSLGGRRKDITDPDWLDAKFLFYDENAQLVRVSIKDALEPSKLGYKYEDVPNAWVKAKPRKAKNIVRKKSKSSSTRTGAVASAYNNGVPVFDPSSAKIPLNYVKEALHPSAISGASLMATGIGPSRHSSSDEHPPQGHSKQGLKEFKERDSKHVEKALSVLVKRPKMVKADDYEEEILVFEGVEIPTNEKVKFDVYVNLTEDELEEEEGEKVGCDIAEYVGSFFNIPHLGKEEVEGKKIRKSDFKLAIGGVLKELGLEEEESFIVTVIPRSKTSLPISIQDVKLEYE